MYNSNKNLLEELDSDVELGEVYTCRICYDETHLREDVIVPCLCSGSGKYICKECLQDWRVNGRSSKSFTHCPTCEFEYHLESNSVPDAFDKGSFCGVVPAYWLGRKSYFRYLVFSDLFTGFVVINVYLIGFAIFLRLLDYNERLVDIMPWDSMQNHVEDHHVIKGFKHHKATYYSASMMTNTLFFLFIAIWNYACRCDASMKKIQHAVSFQRMSLCSVVLCVTIFVLLKVFVGAFIALLSLVVWMQKAAARHMHVLVKKEIANDFQVVDLEITGRLKPKKDIDESSVAWSVSSPPKSHFAASASLMQRLLNVKVHVE